MSVVAHDLRNPVSAVKMLAGALLRGVGEHALPPEMAAQAYRTGAVQANLPEW